MFRRKRMIVSLDRNGVVVNKEVRTFRSCVGMLKHLKKQAKQTDPYVRIMELKGMLTLVYHGAEGMDLITVRLVEKEIG